MRGQLTFAVLFIVLALLLVMLFAVGIPMLTQMSVEAYTTAGEPMLSEANTTAQNIATQSVRVAITSYISEAQTSTTNQVDILSALYKYSWAIILLILTLVVVLRARQVIEYSRGGLV